MTFKYFLKSLSKSRIILWMRIPNSRYFHKMTTSVHCMHLHGNSFRGSAKTRWNPKDWHFAVKIFWNNIVFSDPKLFFPLEASKLECAPQEDQWKEYRVSCNLRLKLLPLIISFSANLFLLQRCRRNGVYGKRKWARGCMRWTAGAGSYSTMPTK